MLFTVRLLIGFIFTFLISIAHAQEPIFRLSQTEGKSYIGCFLSVYQDSTQMMRVEDVISDSLSFKPSDTDVPNFSVSNYNNWIRIKFINDSEDENLILNISNPSIDEVTLYELKNGTIDSLKLTINQSFDERYFKHQFYTFGLNVAINDTATYYLKLASKKQLLLPLSITSQERVVSELISYDLNSGIFVGIMLTVLLYNLFIYIGVRDNHYLAFVHYIFWVAVVQVALLGFLSRIFGDSFLTNVNLITFGGAMSGIASILFIKSFLNTKNYGNTINYILNSILIGDVIAILFLIFGNPILSYQIVNIVAGIGSVVVLIVGFIAYKKGNKSAMLFLVAWTVFLGSVIIFVLKDYGILPYNTITYNAVQIGVSIEALLLSFALADKINIYRKEKEESQSKALKILLDNERLIKEQNTALEIKVNERTLDLTNANKSLKSTLKHLKETQSQLVEAEKMASLGQLTAGVAHEINNPINFVTSNVMPLRRDIDIIWEAISEFEQLALNTVLSKEEKEERISKYKNDLDFDYLKTEVEYLLKGMHEGASRTAEIVKSLRVFSRVDEDTIKTADINEGLESTMVILNSLVKDKVKVVKSYGEIPYVECYAGKLNQVFLNIITNAIYAIDKKYANNIGGELRIETGLVENNSSVEIRISDNGIGIPEDIKSKIFEPFFTTKDVGEGTGLGMSIAYNTVDKHNGKIWVESVLGEGSVFHIVIPIKQST